MINIGLGMIRELLDFRFITIPRRSSMRAEVALKRMATFPYADLDDIIGRGTPLILAPHPDDESLGCGGLIAEACARGRPPVVVVLTDGTMSHPTSPSYPAWRLKAVREAETRRAVAALGVPPDRLHFLGQPDARVPNHGPEMLRIAEHLRTFLHGWDAGSLITTWQHDPHPDHLAAYMIAREAIRGTATKLICYPVWASTLPASRRLPLNELSGARLDITRHLPAKQRAISEHESQHSDLIKDDPKGFRLPSGLLEVASRPFEIYIYES